MKGKFIKIKTKIKKYEIRQIRYKQGDNILYTGITFDTVCKIIGLVKPYSLAGIINAIESGEYIQTPNLASIKIVECE